MSSHQSHPPAVEAIDLRRQDEVAFRESINLVREGTHADFAPGKHEAGVVALFLGLATHAIDEVQSFAEVREDEGLLKVVLFDDLPAGKLT